MSTITSWIALLATTVQSLVGGAATTEWTATRSIAQRIVISVDDISDLAVLDNTKSIPGGIIVMKPTFELMKQIEFRTQALFPKPFIMIDEEGGLVQRFRPILGNFPSAAEQANLTDQDLYQLVSTRAQQLRAHGVTVNFAPVVDIDGTSPAIGTRSYGDIHNTIRSAKVFSQAMNDAGIITVLKHFPGHGRADGDSHFLEVTTPDWSLVEKEDIAPFRELMNSQNMIMVGHMSVPNFVSQPASISPSIYQYLRSVMGFKGIVITDDLGAMKAITDNHSRSNAVSLALNAGADMVILVTEHPDVDFPPLVDSLVDTVHTKPTTLTTILKRKGELEIY